MTQYLCVTPHQLICLVIIVTLLIIKINPRTRTYTGNSLIRYNKGIIHDLSNNFLNYFYILLIFPFLIHQF